jgi:anti-sigma B factor antagonist
MAGYFVVSVRSSDADRWVLAMSGELDVATAPELEQALRAASGSVVIDCGALEFMDATGIGVLVRALRHLDDLRLVKVTPMVRRVITTVGLGGTLLCCDEPGAAASRDRALQSGVEQ